MVILKYIIRSFQKRPYIHIIMSVVGTVIILLLSVLEGAIADQEDKIAFVKNMPITVVLSDKCGRTTEGLTLIEKQLQPMMDDTKLGSFLEDLVLRQENEMIIGTAEEASMEDAGNTSVMKLIGISSLAAAPELSENPEIEIMIDPGFQKLLFTGRSPVCMIEKTVLESIGKSIGDTIAVAVNCFGEWYETELQIGGMIEGSEGDAVYCGWEALGSINNLSDLQGSPESYQKKHMNEIFCFSDRFCAKLINNDNLGAFKDFAIRYYPQVNLDADINNTDIAMTVHDSIYLSSMKELSQNMRLLKALRPVFWVVTCIVSFLVGFIGAGNRRQEIAMLRSLGLGKHRVFVLLLIEQISLAMIGSVFGIGIYRLFGGESSPEAWIFVVVVVLYLIGTAAPAIRLMGDKGLAILTKKD